MYVLQQRSNKSVCLRVYQCSPESRVAHGPNCLDKHLLVNNQG